MSHHSQSSSLCSRHQMMLAAEEEPLQPSTAAQSASFDKPSNSVDLVELNDHSKTAKNQFLRDSSDDLLLPPPFVSTHSELSAATGNNCLQLCHGCRQPIGWPFSDNCVHVIFLAFFVIFLVVGVALTCLGFLNYGEGGPSTKAFRILGIVALLLCIGFLIAACVVVSECLTSALEYEDDQGYHAMRPYLGQGLSQNTIIANPQCVLEIPRLSRKDGILSRPLSLDSNKYPVNNGFSPASLSLSLDESPRIHACPSCSCNRIGTSLSYPETFFNAARKPPKLSTRSPTAPSSRNRSPLRRSLAMDATNDNDDNAVEDANWV